MKRFFTYSILVILLSGAGWEAFSWLQERQHYESTDNAYLKSNSVLISARVEGYITQLNIDDNQIVKKGDVLAVIDDRDYRAKLEQANARVTEAKAYSNFLHANKNTQQSSISNADAQVSAIEAKKRQINQDVARFSALIEKGSAPRQTLDKLQSESQQTSAELRGSQAAVEVQQKQLTSFESNIAQALARIKQAQAQVELAQLDVDYTNIIAPSDGIIGHRGVQIGQFVRPSVNLVHLVSQNPIWIEANFKETQLTHMKIGQPVKIHVDAFPDTILTGKVASFSPASGSEFSLLPPENATGNFTKIVRRVTVKIVFDESVDTSPLKSGLSATVKVQVKPL
jgi:membrane fusion protein (multidrug efflux system)